MKIQINSLEALERLIGDDKEMEISVKESIINSFAKNYLKPVTNSEVMDRITYEVRKDLQNSGFYGILEKKPISIFGNESCLSQKAKELIQNQVHREIDNLISNEVSKVRETIVQDIKSRLDLMASSVSECIREEVQKETIERLVQKKIKDLLEK